MTPITVPDCDFPLGNPGCDNAIAERFLRAGRVPINRSDMFCVYHLDHCRKPTDNSELIVSARLEHQYPEEAGHLLVPAWVEMSLCDAEPHMVPLVEYLGLMMFFSSKVLIVHRHNGTRVKVVNPSPPPSPPQSPRQTPPQSESPSSSPSPSPRPNKLPEPA